MKLLILITSLILAPGISKGFVGFTANEISYKDIHGLRAVPTKSFFLESRRAVVGLTFYYTNGKPSFGAGSVFLFKNGEPLMGGYDPKLLGSNSLQKGYHEYTGDYCYVDAGSFKVSEDTYATYEDLFGDDGKFTFDGVGYNSVFLSSSDVYSADIDFDEDSKQTKLVFWRDGVFLEARCPGKLSPREMENAFGNHFKFLIDRP